MKLLALALLFLASCKIPSVVDGPHKAPPPDAGCSCQTRDEVEVLRSALRRSETERLQLAGQVEDLRERCAP